AKFIDKLRRRGGGPAGRQQVVANDHALSWLHGVFVNLQRVRAIFERIRNARRLGGQFLRLSPGDKSFAKSVSKRRRENESARLDAGHNINWVALVMLTEPVDQRVKSVLIL